MSAIYSVSRPPSVEGIVELVRGTVPHSSGGHPPHWHSQWQVVAVVHGAGWVRVKGSQHATPGGSIFLIPPEIVHSNDVFVEGCAFRSMLIDASKMEGVAASAHLRLERSRISMAPVLNSENWTQRFDRFHKGLDTQRPSLRAEDELEAWIRSLLAQQTDQDPQPARVIQHPAVRRARDYLADLAEETISLQDLARAAGLSQYELCRQFRQAYGMPPHRWQLQIRVERSKPLLRQGIPAGEIALQLGFSDQSHFTRVFRSFTGYPPGRYALEFRKIRQGKWDKRQEDPS